MNLIKGIVPPMVTPLTVDDQLDVESLEKLIEHLISGGVHGLFILGTTGEGPSLSYSLREELIQRVCSQVSGRIPVLVGITDSAYKEAITITEKSKEFGADAVVMAPPFYFSIDQYELIDYTNQMLDELSLPVFLYNQPALTKSEFSLEILDDLLPRPEIIGFKDSSGDLVYFHRLKKMSDSYEVPLYMGPEELLIDALVTGASGGVPGGANIFPSLYVNMFNVLRDGDLEQGLELQDKILSLSEIVYSGSEYGSSNIINGIKTALSIMDICERHVSRPLKGITKKKAKKISDFISEKAEEWV